MAIGTETKVLVGVLAVTILIIVGGALLAGRNDQGSVTTEPVEQERLVRSDDPVLGPDEAQVTVVEFGDFQCPACGAVHPILKQVKEVYKDKPVQFVYRQFPLRQIHEYAQEAAEASLAAQAQGKFWEYHDHLFEDQAVLTRDDLLTHARELGLDADRMARELDEGVYEEAVQQDLTDGNILGVQGTPTFYINGVLYQGQYSVAGFSEAIDTALGGN